MDKEAAINNGYQPVNIIVGKFQPLTMEYIKMARDVYEDTGIKTVLCIVETPKHKVSAVNPFATSDLSYMYANILATRAYPYIEGFMNVKSADIVENTNSLMNIGFLPISWTCTSERYKEYSSMTKRYFKEADLVDSFKVIEFSRKKDDMPASTVKFFIASNDFENFLQYTPFKVLSRSEARKCFDKLMYDYCKILNNTSF